MGAPHQPGGQQPLFGVVLGQPAQITLASRQLGFRPAFQIVGQAFALGVDQPAQPVPAAPAGSVTEKASLARCWPVRAPAPTARWTPGPWCRPESGLGPGVLQYSDQAAVSFMRAFLCRSLNTLAPVPIWRPPNQKQSESASRQRMRRRLVLRFCPAHRTGWAGQNRLASGKPENNNFLARPEKSRSQNPAQRAWPGARRRVHAVRQGRATTPGRVL